MWRCKAVVAAGKRAMTRERPLAETRVRSSAVTPRGPTFATVHPGVGAGIVVIVTKGGSGSVGGAVVVDVPRVVDDVRWTLGSSGADEVLSAPQAPRMIPVASRANPARCRLSG